MFVHIHTHAYMYTVAYIYTFLYLFFFFLLLFTSSRLSLDTEKQATRQTARYTQGGRGMFQKVSSTATYNLVFKPLSTALIFIKIQLSQ